jgi:glycosyltransferase involved in cell wall biosynthesis
MSVCIPVYNGSRFLQETIESVLRQDFQDFEIIVLDNASTDNTSDILDSFSDSRLSVHRNSFTVPAHQNWSNVLKFASGKWTKLLCADDLLAEDALSHALEIFMNNPSIKICAGSRNVVNSMGQELIKARPLVKQEMILSGDSITRKTLQRGTNPLGESLCLMWDTQLTEQVGEFSKRWNYFIDLDYWLRLSSISPVYYTPRMLGSFRISENSWTSELGLGVVREAKHFFFEHAAFDSYKGVQKSKALSIALAKSIARKSIGWLSTRKMKNNDGVRLSEQPE